MRTLASNVDIVRISAVRCRFTSASSLLVVALLGACSARLPRVLSEQQTESLAREVLQHTPDHTHFGGATFRWVLFDPKETSVYPEAVRRIRTELARKYIVYDHESQLPPEAIRSDGVTKAYVNGFYFSVRVIPFDTTTLEVGYQDYEGNTAAGGQVFRYRWNGDRWIEVWKGPTVIASFLRGQPAHVVVYTLLRPKRISLPQASPGMCEREPTA
jgi:hypothetical protein